MSGYNLICQQQLKRKRISGHVTFCIHTSKTDSGSKQRYGNNEGTDQHSVLLRYVATFKIKVFQSKLPLLPLLVFT